MGTLPVSVIVAVRNEARNLPRCLESVTKVAEVYVVDSQSTDGTQEIAESYGATVVQFHYGGGWPKKRQWALDTLQLACEWVLLVDADEALTPELIDEIENPKSTIRALTAITLSFRCIFSDGDCGTVARASTSLHSFVGTRAITSAA